MTHRAGPRIAAALGVAAIAGGAMAAAGDARSTRTCAGFSFSQRGVKWEATRIRTVEHSCRSARTLIRTYAVPRNCQFRPLCHIGKYTCRTSKARGSEFDERCTRGRSVVSWHARYTVR